MFRVKRGFTAILLSLLVLFGLGLDKVSAAACTGTTQYGTVTMTANIPQAGEYVLWARVQPTTTAANLLQVEINTDTCFSVGNTSIPANAWTWVNYQGATSSNKMKYTFNSTGTRTIKVYGQSANVKVDKLIFLGVNEQCSSGGSTPQGDGSNCATGVSAPTTPTQPPPPQTTPEIVSENAENIAQVEYYVNGKLQQISSGAAPFDPGVLPDGDYELTTKVTYKDGTTAEASQDLVVTGSTVAQKGIRGWINRHKRLVFSVLATLIIGGIIALVLFIIRFIHHRRMYLTHHGLMT